MPASASTQLQAPSLSAVLIVHNEAQRLSACLQTLDFCAEILVVDSGSSDATVEIARQHGTHVRVIESHWRGFGPQKQFAVEQATHDWVLCIDADERVSERLRESVLAVLPAPTSMAPHARNPGSLPPTGGTSAWDGPAPTFSTYRLARCNRFMGRYLRHGEGYPDWCLRLFDRRHAHWSADAVHEKVVTDTAAPSGVLHGDLLHDSAESLENYLAKQNRYSTLAAEAALARGERATVLHLLLSPLVRFVKFYLLRRGFLDGVPGLIHILVGCGASFAKYAKMLSE